MSCDCCNEADFETDCDCGCSYCRGCALYVECEWCEDPSDCPECTELGRFDTDTIVCMPCLRDARDNGQVRYCHDHRWCYLRVDKDVEVFHRGCETTGDRKELSEIMRALWSDL